MKKIWLIALASVAFACGGGERNNENEAATEDAGAVEEHSGSNITPQVEDSAGRLQVDTIGSASSAEEAKESGLEGN